MGINVSGFAFNTNFNFDVNELAKKLNIELVFEKELPFYEASSSLTDRDDNYLDIYFTNSGTIVMDNDPFLVDKDNSINCAICAFGISETTMTFVLNYFENGQDVRKKFISEEQILSEFGDKIEQEEETEDISDQVFLLIENLTKVKFHEIEGNVKRYKYSFLKKIYDNEKQIVREAIGNCPRCLGDGYVNRDDINRLNMNRFWGTGKCRFCDGTGFVSPEKEKATYHEITEYLNYDISTENEIKKYNKIVKFFKNIF